MKRGENEAKKKRVMMMQLSSSQQTPQHYTSSFNIFDKRSFVLFRLFSIYLQKQKQTHSLINELYKTYHILMRFCSLEAISKKKLAVYRRIELVLQQNKTKEEG